MTNRRNRQRSWSSESSESTATTRSDSESTFLLVDDATRGLAFWNMAFWNITRGGLAYFRSDRRGLFTRIVTYICIDHQLIIFIYYLLWCISRTGGSLRAAADIWGGVTVSLEQAYAAGSNGFFAMYIYTYIYIYILYIITPCLSQGVELGGE